MSQLALFTDPTITRRCPDCGRKLSELYSSARPRPPWDRSSADWQHGAIWLECPCSPRVVVGCVPAPDPRRVSE